MSPLRKVANCIKWYILDEIFDFGNSVMLEHQWIEKMKNIAKRNIFGFVSFRSGLIIALFALTFSCDDDDNENGVVHAIDDVLLP